MGIECSGAFSELIKLTAYVKFSKRTHVKGFLICHCSADRHITFNVFALPLVVNCQGYAVHIMDFPCETNSSDITVLSFEVT